MESMGRISNDDACAELSLRKGKFPRNKICYACSLPHFISIYFSALSWLRILCFTKLESSSFLATFTDQIVELQCLSQGFEARASKNVVYIVCRKSEALEGDLEFIKVGDTVSITISVLPQISVNFSLKVFELDKGLPLLLLNNIAKVFPRNVCFLNDMIDDRENTEFLKTHDIRVLCDSLQG